MIDDEGELRPVRYGDIAVLARSRNGLDSLVEALQNHNIPYILHAGAGFYEAQEIIDMISFLRFIQNPNDDIALSSLLHSPLFGLPDSELFRISAERDGITFWEKFQNYCLKNKNDLSGETHRARELLEHIIHIAPRMTIPRLIIHILEECGWYGAIAGYPAEKQMKANIDKLIDKAREFEFRGFRSLLDFVNEIEMLTEEGSGESEAVFMAGENAVNILTIHASKGLEFPVVALFRSGADSGRSASDYLSDKLGLTFKMPVETEVKGVTTDVETPLHSANKMLRKFADDAEEKRILYVALTRAKDHLIISGSIKKNPRHYLESIMAITGVSPDVLESEETEFLQEIRESLEFRDGDYKFHKYMIFPVKIYTDLQDVELSESDSGEMPDRELKLDEISSSINNINFSATKLIRYENDFEEYFKRYRLGLPETSPDEVFKTRETEADQQISAATEGTVIHGTMESIMQWTNNASETDEEKLRSTLYRMSEALKLSISEEKIAEMMNECADTVKTGLIKRYAGKLGEAQFERQLSMPAGKDFLYGAIDLLIRNDAGEFEVWDWKTNRLASLNEITETAAKYELQLKIYAYMVSLLYPQQNQVITRLLFTKLAKPGADDPAWTYYRAWTKQELTEFGEELPELINKIKKRTYHL